MKIALISDIHANIEALEAVLADIETRKVDEILCLGDIVGYGANPNECIDLVRKTCSLVLLGNHDAAAVGMLSTQHFNIHAKIAIEWTSDNLKKSGHDYLLTLPLKENRYSHTFVHATPYEPNMWYYITSLEEAAFNFQFFETSFCFVGHTHIPIIIVLEQEKEVYVHPGESLEYGALANVRFLINVGKRGPAARQECQFLLRHVRHRRQGLHLPPHRLRRAEGSGKNEKNQDAGVSDKQARRRQMTAEAIHHAGGCQMKRLALATAVCAALILSCANGKSPFSNPADAKIVPQMSLHSLDAKNDSVRVNTALQCTVQVYLPNLIDSFYVHSGTGGADSIIASGAVTGVSFSFSFSEKIAGDYALVVVIVKADKSVDSLTRTVTVYAMSPVVTPDSAAIHVVLPADSVVVTFTVTDPDSNVWMADTWLDSATALMQETSFAPKTHRAVISRTVKKPALLAALKAPVVCYAAAIDFDSNMSRTAACTLYVKDISWAKFSRRCSSANPPHAA